MRKQGVFLASLMLLLSTAAFAQLPPPLAEIFALTPDARRGAALFTQRCAECHGSGGNSVNPGFPRLAGQVREYALIQLFILREGIRESTLMNPIAARLSDQNIADITAYFSSQTPAGAPWDGQDPALVEQGAAIFALGNYESGVIACSVCHGRAGEGVEQLGIPRIAGQSPDYLKRFLRFFAVLPDVGDAAANAMSLNISRLSEEEIDAISAFLASQPWGGP